MTMVALIPARAGSKRIPGKNTRPLAGHPLIAYTIAAADISNLFVDIIVCSDDLEARAEGQRWGCAIVSRAVVADDQPDIVWVRQALVSCPGADAFAILRPTSPFRTAATIRRAYDQFRKAEVHSIRAVQPAKEHPAKQWTWPGPGYPMKPVLEGYGRGAPWHSSPTQTLAQTYIQNASLEMAWTYVVQSFNTISGNKIAPFFTEGHEGFDLNTEDDWREAERLIQEGLVELPTVSLARVPTPAAAL